MSSKSSHFLKFLKKKPNFTKLNKRLQTPLGVKPRLLIVNSITENTNMRFMKICDSPIPNIQRGSQAHICGYLLFLKLAYNSP